MERILPTENLTADRTVLLWKHRRNENVSRQTKAEAIN